MRPTSHFIAAAYPLLLLRRWHSSITCARSMSKKTYEDAIQDLNSLQSNATILDTIRASGGRANQYAIPEMLEYLERIGYSPSDLNRLNVVHITGTKGKGSTSAFVDSILRHAKPDWKTGLYTSPHLVAVRERIRINGSPISEEAFTKYFYEVWNRLHENTNRRLENTSLIPSYFRYLTLMAFHTFLSEKVDATVLEVGVGGTYDSTNIVPKPVVTGVTALGLDHVSVLGKTLPEIAWHKGGIYKEGVPATTVEQPQEGLKILQQQATDLKAAPFYVVPLCPTISGIQLGLPGAHQYQNACLATELARIFLQKRGIQIDNNLPESFVAGLENTKWPGRCQTVSDPSHNRITWYLDGAHTSESMQCCLQWFVKPDVGLFQGDRKGIRVLIFNCTHGRAGDGLLRTVHETIAQCLTLVESRERVDSFFDHVIFCTNLTYLDGNSKSDLTEVARPTNLDLQNKLALSWSEIIPSFPSSRVHIKPTIADAVQFVQGIEIKSGEPIKVLVAGSLHLVGGIIEVAGLAKEALK